jgi:mannose-6-phosphate isomerase
MEILAPFRLAPVSVPKVWGAPQMLGPLAEYLEVTSGVGEVWLVSAYDNVTRACGGPLEGMGLDELHAQYGRSLAGDNHPLEFPLTLKLLNVGDWLSVQVHSDTQEEDRGEVWHVLHTEHPDTEIVMGLKIGAGRQEVEEAVERGDLTDLLAKIPARANDTFLLPSGTVHSVGPGLVLFELQQPTGVAYRFHDWNRPDINGAMRQLHHEKALQALTLSGHAPSEPLRHLEVYGAPNRLRLLVETPTFALLRVDASQTYRPWWGGAKLRIIFVLEGAGQMSSPGHYFSPMDIGAGQTWLLPAGLTTPLLTPEGAKLSFLEAVA